MRLDEELDRAIGDGPPHRAVAERIEAGRRTVRRRRGLATGAAALAVVAVVGGVWSITTGDDGSVGSRVPLAGEPTRDDGSSGERADNPSLGSAPIALDETCRLVLNDGVTVVDQVDEPFGPQPGTGCAFAVAFDDDDAEYWTVLQRSDRMPGGYGAPPVGGVAFGQPVPADPALDFRDWVSQQSPTIGRPYDGLPRTLPAAVDDLVVLDGAERLTAASPGVTVIEQTPEVDLRDFAEPGDLTAAGQVRVLDRICFVLAREADGFTEYFVDEARDGETLEEFLQRAGELYDSGAGLL